MKVAEETMVTTLPVMEAFYTLQGEGFHTGKAACFIRLGGCDVGCFWCDVKESWDADIHPKKSIEEIIDEAKKAIRFQASGFRIDTSNLTANTQNPISETSIAVITGGEPLMHNLDELTSQLQQNHFNTHVETSGSSPLTGSWNWICLSPKKFKQPLTEVCEAAHELKVIIYNKSDFKWAEENAARVSNHCRLYLQPEWTKASAITPLIIDYIKANPQWQLSLQIHKYLNIP